MFRNVHNPSGSSPQPRNPAARRRTVFIALVFALVIVGAGQSAPAQAALAGDTIDISLYPRMRRGAQAICVGDKVAIAVSVLQRIERAGAPSFGHLIGVDVKASVVDSYIGTISPASGVTRVQSIPPSIVYFTFTAGNPGTTLIQFSGKVNALAFLGWEISSDIVRANLTVTVENCEYKVNLISVFYLEESFAFSPVAMIDEAGLTVNAEGTGFTGSASVHWELGATFNEAIAPCTLGAIVPPPSKAYLNGELEGLDLILNIDFEPVLFSINVTCPGAGDITGWLPVSVPPAPLTITVVGSEGVFFKRHPLIEGLIGESAIIVDRVIN